VARGGDLVRIADGFYRPDQGAGITAGDRFEFFQLPSGLTVQGGYAGCGHADPDERDPHIFESVLTGDLLGDDRQDFVNTSDNSYHVVLTAGVGLSTILDGVTVTGGNADGVEPHLRGGGLYNEGGSPTIRGVTFRANRATLGGAINNEGGSPIIEHCIFANNAAGFSGAAIRGWQSGPLVFDSLFVNNRADAGAVAWFGASTPTFENCTAHGNQAPQGNAFAFASCCPTQPSTFVATNCILADGGDEVFNDDASSINIMYSDVEGGWPGEGNRGDAPDFAPGPAGCYYLAHTAAGQPVTSGSVDAGDRTAAAAGLAARTTRSDESPDEGIVDVGYHYTVTGRPRTPGDVNLDVRVDLLDAACFQRCFTGVGPTDVPPCCRIFDVNFDADVDGDDVAVFVPAVTGP
jgi:hypothetical protein